MQQLIFILVFKGNLNLFEVMKMPYYTAKKFSEGIKEYYEELVKALTGKGGKGGKGSVPKNISAASQNAANFGKLTGTKL